jgi:hypothetical protein
MNKVNKFDTKRTVQLLFQTNGVRQVDMANDLQITEGLLSGWLSPGNEADGFVYRYLRGMGWLSTNAPVVFNEIDTLVQGHITRWRATEGRPEAENSDLFIIRLHHLSSKVVEMVLGRKPENDIKAALIELETLLMERRLCMDAELVTA